MLRGCVLSLSAGVIYASAHAPLGWGAVTGWLCLLPLLAAIRKLGWQRAALLGWLFGVVANLLVFHWVFTVPGFRPHHGLILASYLGLYPAIWAAAVRAFGREESAAWLAFAAITWMMLEYVRGQLGFLALPWGTLGQSQVDSVLVAQSASLFGEPAIALLVAWGNGLLSQWLLGVGWRVLGIRTAPLLIALTYGLVVLAMEWRSTSPLITVATLRTDFPSFGPERASAVERTHRAIELARELPDSGIDLVAFPESTFINVGTAPQVGAELQRLAERTGAVVVAGEAASMKFESHVGSIGPKADVRNGALVFEPGRAPRRYTKELLVPFAEVTPLRGMVELPAWLVSPPAFEVIAGDGPDVLHTQSAGSIGVMVCWESVFAGHARASVQAGARVLVQLANEGWFSSPTAGEQHNVTVRMRAIEHQMPAMIASNLGPAAVIDRHGRHAAVSAPRDGAAWVIAKVQPAERATVYSRVGDALVAAGLGIVALLVACRWHTRE